MTAIELLEQIHRLLQLKGENPFRVRAYQKAAEALEGVDDLVDRARAGTLTDLSGVGAGISEILSDFLLRGKTPVLDELRVALPPGLLEISEIPGVGAKKAQQLVEELAIASVADLETACREGRLLNVRNFGEKTQKKILDGIAFFAAGQGKRRLGDAFPIAEGLLNALVEASEGMKVSETGELRRRVEVLSRLDFLVELPPENAREFRERLLKRVSDFRESLGRQAMPMDLHFAESRYFGYELARTTATPESWKAQGAPVPFDAPDEATFFSKLNFPELPPETRETGEELTLAREGKLERLLPWKGLQGVFHNHTVASDGRATLEQMVLEARRLGFKYIGISDHSQSAFYAKGLKLEAIDQQEREIRKLQDRYPDIRIFWGIESDILADGSLDYEPETLARFDFVIGSVHSRFQMDREAMTSRVLEAIRNPHLRFLGHLTGRLLLNRAGFELDIEKVISEATRHDVAIEINSHPWRLEIDWRWGPELRRHGTLVSVNPDAHDTAGISAFRYGIAVARKAMLPAEQVLNSRPVDEVEKWLKRR